MLLINAKEVRELLSMKEAIESNKKAFLLHSAGETEVPVRTCFDLDGRDLVLIMPAYVKGDVKQVGVKLVSVFPENIKRGLTSVPAQVLLFDLQTGFIKVMLAGTELTRIRTGAISGVATDTLARRDASVFALFGTGGQAVSQLEAVLCVRDIKEVRIFDVDAARISTFIEANRALAEKYGAGLVAAKSPAEAIDGADVITTVTTSSTAVFDGTMVKKGAHVNGVGSYLPTTQELDTRLLNRARVFVDNRETVMAEAGDFLIPIKNGDYKADKIAGEIGDVLAGKLVGRSSDDEITVLKTVGYAVLDVVAANIVYENAITRGIGTEVDI
ncbi:ornithine cyclodeaminase family protein [Synergistaceae bacterium OttesenSCG-928-I11]|nr:ornithine cyclodeaminase family protein [Synergistaceae bacterium OttesenSCG-928-I11]